MIYVILLIILSELGAVLLISLSIYRELRRANRPTAQKCNTLSHPHSVPRGPAIITRSQHTRVEDGDHVTTYPPKSGRERAEEWREAVESQRRMQAFRVVGAAIMLSKDKARVRCPDISAARNAQELWDAVEKYEALP